MAKTTDEGVAWTSISGPSIPSRQTGYNFHITVHPDNPDIVYYGEIQLWKTTTGDAPWEDITGKPPTSPDVRPGIHVDQHVLVFDPTNPDIIWAGNDGGVFRSDNAGESWIHCNRDLATLQYMSISLHPQWEAVILGGTQDNGTHRYSGNPAWEFSDVGDGGFTAIDPGNPTRMYHGFTRSTFYRSDQAGKIGSWILKTGPLAGSSVEFYPPFTLDPSDPTVCYFGENRLWRSPASAPGSAGSADTWEDITGPLTGNITAIAVDPTDSATIYVGTVAGKIYRVQKTGPTWAPADITTTDITAPPLPLNQCISDIAIDGTGTVWLTFSSIFWSEASGEFNNNHVYRLLPGLGNSWELRSNGLAKANPINTIVIDPANNNRLFCGGDVGVFRTEDAGGNWILWSEGLPNAPVFDRDSCLYPFTQGCNSWQKCMGKAY